jgi:hypothetical protein
LINEKAKAKPFGARLLKNAFNCFARNSFALHIYLPGNMSFWKNLVQAKHSA